MFKLYNDDCMNIMKTMEDNSVDFTLTDIPYDGVNRDTNGLRTLSKGSADVITFDLKEFVREVFRVTKNNICIFCNWTQFSNIFNFLNNVNGGGATVRPIVWEKTNPSPMNGKNVYLSGVEFAVWAKKKRKQSIQCQLQEYSI